MPLVAVGAAGEMEGLALATVVGMVMGVELATGAEALVGWAEVGSAMEVGLVTEVGLTTGSGVGTAPDPMLVLRSATDHRLVPRLVPD